MPIDTTSMLPQLLKALWNIVVNNWYILIILLAIRLLNTSWGKGVIGEFLVNLGLKLKLDGKKYLLLKNVTLPTEDGSTQIDHIVVSQFGVFVIETKNRKGWIFGSEKQPEWTQNINKRYSNPFPNPLHQNYKHTMTLASLLDLPEAKLFSVVVFINGTFKKPMPQNVMYRSKLCSYIRSKTEIMFTQQEVGSIYETIQGDRFKESLLTSIKHARHVNDIKRNKELDKDQVHKESKASVDSGKVCTKCGSPMVLRTPRKKASAGNKYWVCSRYPKCRARRELT